MTITIQDSAGLLGRPDRAINLVNAARDLEGSRVLITGAGGSIGAHLSQTLAQSGVEELILLDHHEHSLFDLVKRFQDTPQTPTFVLGDVRDTPKMARVFRRHRPTHVVHLAAYKHVPFGQQFPEETVSVNFIATRELLELSLSCGVGRFVYPSSDKAVNPPSLYGSTKRLSEVATQQIALTRDMPYTSVRYVNVLGTRGSVIETFSAQLAAGATLTVTSPDMTRYWMTMSEAVWLLVIAATRADPADILMLDALGEISVVDMARRLSERLGHSKTPPIRFTGMRPGERLREELLSANESFIAGPVSGILRVAHNDRQKQLAHSLPSFHDELGAPPEELTAKVMDLAKRLQ